MISTSDFKNGISIEIDGDIYTIIEFQHVKPGKGGAFVRTKLKNLQTGAVLDKTFRAGEKFEQAIIDRKDMQYIYNDGHNYYFMDKDSYEQIPIVAEQIGDATDLLKEGNEAQVTFWQNKVMGIELPGSIALEVIKTIPGAKGNTVSGALKPATLETGAEVQVPLFIKEGDIIKVNTKDKKYQERVQ
ncbi:MAG: elongation factor P [Candidatus Caldatribacteriota bacterium]|nr:elongation factor P [Atribacterota bacterium]MDD3031827.1 elongation factor P [Atribacterota bacterium]MDD3641182.1 elongation factor P [Atribacterota bacterium]MDD4288730.1 elongation factor P [Atribacterota bacterium]MDD4765292.1 elongation factor P [Atribacterota bacterium]